VGNALYEYEARELGHVYWRLHGKRKGIPNSQTLDSLRAFFSAHGTPK